MERSRGCAPRASSAVKRKLGLQGMEMTNRKAQARSFHPRQPAKHSNHVTTRKCSKTYSQPDLLTVTRQLLLLIACQGCIKSGGEREGEEDQLILGPRDEKFKLHAWPHLQQVPGHVLLQRSSKFDENTLQTSDVGLLRSLGDWAMFSSYIVFTLVI